MISDFLRPFLTYPPTHIRLYPILTNLPKIWYPILVNQPHPKSFENPIIVYLELEAQKPTMIFNAIYDLSKLPYFTP